MTINDDVREYLTQMERAGTLADIMQDLGYAKPHSQKFDELLERYEIGADHFILLNRMLKMDKTMEKVVGKAGAQAVTIIFTALFLFMLTQCSGFLEILKERIGK